MAQILDTFPERDAATYPWEQWTDGRVWALKQGQDFHTTPVAFVRYARRYARRHDRTVSTSRNTANGTVTLQFNKEN